MGLALFVFRIGVDPIGAWLKEEPAESLAIRETDQFRAVFSAMLIRRAV